MQSQAPSAAPRTLVLVFDGLRARDLNPRLMPRLSEFVRSGTVYERSHSGFPTETMAGAGELFTGSYPERSGITGNRMYVPGRGATGTYIEEPAGLKAITKAYGDSLPVPSLFDVFARAGKTSAIVGKLGPTNLAAANGATWAVTGEGVHDAARSGLERELGFAVGSIPERETPNSPQSQWFAEVATHIDKTRRPDLLTVWFTDPDGTQHAHGVGRADARRALRDVDAQAGALLDALRGAGSLRNMNVIITSDHGFSDQDPAVTKPLDLHDRLIAAGLDVAAVIPSGNQQSIHFAKRPSRADMDKLREVVADAPYAHLVDTVVENSSSQGQRSDGKLTGADLRLGRERSGDALVVYRRSTGRYGGVIVNPYPRGNKSSHGSLGWSDENNTLALVGPRFERGARTKTAAGIVDIAPTILDLHGLPVPRHVQGRALREAYRDGKPGVEHVPQRRNVATQQVRLGKDLVETRLTTTRVGTTDYFESLRSTRAPA